MAKKLEYGPSGTLTIAQFTDLHWENGGEGDQLTKRLMESVIDAENPDLIVFTGDIIDSLACEDPRQSFRQAVSVAEERGVLWAAVFGNHDTEAEVTREQLMEVQREHAFCFSQPGPNEITGIGNYVIEIMDRRNELDKVLYFLDSGSYSLNRVSGYGSIARDQIAWYESMSSGYRRRYGRPVPALAFFHIPLPEYDQVWQHGACFGEKHESVCCPQVNTGMFAAMVDMGDVMGTFVGHDHVNDYCGEWHGIRLCYGRKTGYNSYGRDGFAQGARIIRLSEGVSSFETWLRLETRI